MEVLDSSEASQASSDIEILEPVSSDVEIVERPASSAVSQVSSDIEIAEVEPERDRTAPYARSLEDSAARSEEDPAQSVANHINHIPAHHDNDTSPSIDNAIDQLTAELATLCLGQLEKSLALGDDIHEVGSAGSFEDELRVRFKSQDTYEVLMIDSFRWRRLWRRGHALPAVCMR